MSVHTRPLDLSQFPTPIAVMGDAMKWPAPGWHDSYEVNPQIKADMLRWVDEDDDTNSWSYYGIAGFNSLVIREEKTPAG